MPRYFIEVAYLGTRYSGFQVQENAETVQGEIENAFLILHRKPVTLTGSSRTDAGVHALQNYFHFDFEEAVHSQFVYKMNAILPRDLVVKRIFEMNHDSHARFDALSREYEYNIHSFKDPFLSKTSLYYPYRPELSLLKKAGELVTGQHNFFAFAKTNTQVKNFECRILKSDWHQEGDRMVYAIQGSRFLRGMVRLLTASQLKVGRGKMSMDEFASFFREEKKCGHSVPAHGLFLKAVHYPENYFPAPAGL